jgi:D-alanyl-D-alanine carboxypeptidase/D-alanyl-D-alanine-endopeptidase (penicillin-binding protein 4)
MHAFTGRKNTFRLLKTAGITFICLFLISVFILPVDCHAASPGHLLNKPMEWVLFEQKIHSFLPDNARWSLCAVDIDTGETIISSGNAGKSLLIPGSVVKLLVAALALETSITGAEFDTSIAFHGVAAEEELKGDIYIRGSGNPLLLSEDINFAAQKIRSSGIKTITGDIILDDSYFDAREFANKLNRPAYASPAAFGMDLHTVSITFSGNTKNITAIPPNDELKFYFSNSAKQAIRRIDDLSYEISLNPADSAILRQRFALSDPGLYAAGALKTILHQNGVTASGSVKRGRAPSGATEIVRLESKDMAVMLKEMNGYSLNVLADNLLLSIGAKMAGSPGTVGKGVDALNEFLRGLGIKSEEMNLADGSGLSRDNGITAGQMADFLMKITKKEWFQSFYETVPAIGMDGELLESPSGLRIFKLKTGRLMDVFSIAGYVDNNGRQTALAYMVNVPGADLLTVSDFIKALDKALPGKTTLNGEL